MISNSNNKIHQTWETLFWRPLYPPCPPTFEKDKEVVGGPDHSFFHSCEPETSQSTAQQNCKSYLSVHVNRVILSHRQGSTSYRMPCSTRARASNAFRARTYPRRRWRRRQKIILPLRSKTTGEGRLISESACPVPKGSQ